jgi:hypothetical protein
MTRKVALTVALAAASALLLSACLPILGKSAGQGGASSADEGYLALVNTWVPRQVAVNRQLDADLAQRNRQAASDRSKEYSALYGEVNAATPPQRYATAHAELLASLGHSMNAADAFANGSDDLFVQESEAAAAALNRYNAAAKELGAGTEY